MSDLEKAKEVLERARGESLSFDESLRLMSQALRLMKEWRISRKDQLGEFIESDINTKREAKEEEENEKLERWLHNALTPEERELEEINRHASCDSFGDLMNGGEYDF